MSRHRRPPWLLRVLSRLLIRGRDASFVRADMADGRVADIDSGMSRHRADWRYACNLVGSAATLLGASVVRVFAGGHMLDARLGARMLFKKPLLTGVAMLALGLGIPTSLIVHHAMDVMLQPLPVPEGERVMGVRYWNQESRRPVPATLHDYELWRGTLDSFSSLAAARTRMVNLRTDNASDPPIRGSDVDGSFFDVLVASPLMGRTLTARDQAPSAPDVVVISEGIWSSRFARDPEILGRDVVIGVSRHTVVGVMPSTFRYPVDDDVWMPLRDRSVDYALGQGPELLVFGRLGDAAEEASADLEVTVVTDRLVQDHPDVYEHRVGQVVPMSILLLGDAESLRNDPEVLLIQSLLLVILLIVCGNVGTLILARTATRTGEIAIRTALGAGRARIVSQIFVEALVLSTAATGFGLLLGEGVARWFNRIGEQVEGLPFWIDFTLRPGIVFTALGLSAACAAVAGVVPALKATRSGVHGTIRQAGSGSTMRFGWGSTVLIVSEIILAVGFLATGGTLVRSQFQDTEGRLGFDPERFLYAQVRVPPVSEGNLASVAHAGPQPLAPFQTEILRRLQADPEVGRTAMGLQLPGWVSPDRPVILDGSSDATSLNVQVARVDLGFFGQMEHALLDGRDFTSSDVEGDSTVHRSAVIVNTTFVEQVLEGRNPVGRRFRYPSQSVAEEADPDWLEIIGVVGPLGMNVNNPLRDAGVYHPMARGESNPIRYLVEAADGDPGSLAPRFRELVAELDPEATVSRAVPLLSMIESQSRVIRWIYFAEVGLAAVAFLLSVTGLSALMSFTVSQRTREIGVRMALGARPWSIVGTIARRAAVQLGLGLSFGGFFAWALLRRIVDDNLTAPTSMPWTIGVTVTAAALIGAAACVAPTVRGLRTQPVDALSEA